MARGARAHRHVKNEPTAHRALFTARCVLGAVVCLRGQLAMRSTPRRWSRLLCADTVPCWRLRLRSVVAVSFSSRGARRARASSRGEPADRPQSTCLCAQRAWNGCLRGQLATRYTPRRWPRLHCADTALDQRLRLRTVVVVSFSSRGAQRLRASSRGEKGDRPQSTCHCVQRAWRCCLSARPTRNALHPTPLAEAPLRRHRA